MKRCSILYVLKVQWLSFGSQCTVCNPMYCHREHARLSVLHYLPEFAQIHVYWVSNAIWPSHPRQNDEDRRREWWYVFVVMVVQSLSHVQLFATPWTAAHQASLSFTISCSLLKLMSIESLMPSNHLILCNPLLLLPSIFPSTKIFSNESVLASSGQSIQTSDSASVLQWTFRVDFL